MFSFTHICQINVFFPSRGIHYHSSNSCPLDEEYDYSDCTFAPFQSFILNHLYQKAWICHFECLVYFYPNLLFLKFSGGKEAEEELEKARKAKEEKGV